MSTHPSPGHLGAVPTSPSSPPGGRVGRLLLFKRLLITSTVQAAGSPQVDASATTTDHGPFPTLVIRRRQLGDRGPFTANPKAKPAEAHVVGWRGPGGQRLVGWIGRKGWRRRRTGPPGLSMAGGASIQAQTCEGRLADVERALGRETMRLIAAETLDLDHLADLEAGNQDPQDRRLHDIIVRRRYELGALFPEPEDDPAALSTLAPAVVLGDPVQDRRLASIRSAYEGGAGVWRRQDIGNLLGIIDPDGDGPWAAGFRSGYGAGRKEAVAPAPKAPAEPTGWGGPRLVEAALLQSGDRIVGPYDIGTGQEGGGDLITVVSLIDGRVDLHHEGGLTTSVPTVENASKLSDAMVWARLQGRA